jgi:hypothetical protein
VPYFGKINISEKKKKKKSTYFKHKDSLANVFLRCMFLETRRCRYCCGSVCILRKFIYPITGYVCDHKLTRHVDECYETNIQSLTVTCCTWVHCSYCMGQLCDLEDVRLRFTFLIRQGHDLSHSKHTSFLEVLLFFRALDQTLLPEAVL